MCSPPSPGSAPGGSTRVASNSCWTRNFWIGSVKSVRMGSLEIRHVIPLRGTTPGGPGPEPPRDGLRPDGMDPAVLAPGRGPDLGDRLPEAQRPVADGQRGLGLQAPGLHVQQQLLPGLLALPVAV